MDFSYSPGCEAGGTLHLSPTHLSRADHTVSRSLRRSLSRSPSKPSLNRSSNPPSIKPRTYDTPNLGSNTTCNPSDMDPPSAKKTRPTLRRTGPMSPLPQSLRPSGNQTERALSDRGNMGNAAPDSPPGRNSSPGQENFLPSSPESPSFAAEAGQDGSSPVKHETTTTKNFELLSRAPVFRPGRQEWRPVKSSPLKRSDAVLNLALDPPSSPSVKRRTICGSIVTGGFSKFQAPLHQSQSDREPTSSDEEYFSRDFPPRSSQSHTPQPLRRSKGPSRTAERAVQSIRRSLDMARERKPAALSTNKDRLSLEVGSQESDSDETIAEPESTLRVQFARPPRNQPHPLSKTLSPTSPSPTWREGFPRGAPLFDSPAVPALDFSKSLPIGAMRPSVETSATEQEESQNSSFEASFATPKFYHIARPDPTAFRSTGLISKKHRNPDDIPPPPEGHPDMPDTPCKRFPGTFAFSTSPTPTNSAIKDQRHPKPPSVTPSKPSHPHVSYQSAAPPGRSFDFFNPSRLARRDSFGSFEGEEGAASSQCQTESQSSADELPPTPTKQVLGAPNIKNNSLRSNLLGRRPSLAPGTFAAPEIIDSQQQHPADLSSKSSLTCRNLECVAGDDYGSPGDLTEVSGSSYSSALATPPKFGVAEELRKRLWRKSSEQTKQERILNAKTYPSAVFQQPSRISSADHSVPCTPVDNGLPDPSGLSISPGWKKAGIPSAAANAARTGTIPATPTHRDGIVPPSFSRPIATPSHHALGHDLDLVLSQRFKKVEWYGKGQFSEVYKVFEPRGAVPVQLAFPSSAGSKTPLTSMPDKIYIVKKSKVPYASMKIRQRKLREAAVMAALGKSDHVVHFINSWEASGHLYIQTEFCEEGSLEQFLAKTGNKGRLDDFRIWKILIELGEGLKHIHDSGFIHLDLKPANVFIDFAGVLKIGDFGLACEWPAPAHVEGEGDRRYIGPDLLQGAFDKPADIFALGMMMFEIAGNCVLPDNGTYWQHLRSGNWSDLPSLTSASSYSSFKDESNKDFLVKSSSLLALESIGSGGSLYPASFSAGLFLPDASAGGSFSQPGLPEEQVQPPTFMLDPEDSEALEQIVHWMMEPNPADRPVIDQVLDVGGCRWVGERRRAGAVVFEGAWGPPTAVIAHGAGEQDEEMLDAP